MTHRDHGPSSAQIREEFGPIIDGDGHTLEFMPALLDCIREVAGESLGARAADNMMGAVERHWWYDRPTEELVRDRVPKPLWWAWPTISTLDHAASMLPSLLRSRLDELGIDFGIINASRGINGPYFEEEEIRRTVTRGINVYHAEVFKDVRDRLLPTALIPMNTPDEAIDELEFVVNSLQMPIVTLLTVFRRSGPQSDSWIDTFSLDSPHDYDPFWARCEQLGVSPAFHGTVYGFGSRTSPTNFVYNHTGSFSAAHDALWKGMILGGLPRRHPDMKFAFLEGGASWAATLLIDLISHWRQRGPEGIATCDPERLDVEELTRLFEAYGSPRVQKYLHEVKNEQRLLGEPTGYFGVDEWKDSGITSSDDISQIFASQLYIGCEPDDVTVSMAFNNQSLMPEGVQLHPLFGSDVGHFDTPHMEEAVHEAYELLEEGLVDETQFRAFMFGNAAGLWGGADGGAFRRTVVEDAVRAHHSGTPGR